MKTLLPLISTSCIVISAVLIAIGWGLIVKGKREQHKKVMLFGALFALLFFIIYLTKTTVFGNTPFTGPDYLKPVYLIFLLFHIVLATVGAVFGAITLLFAWKERFAKHRKLGRVTAVTWFVVAVTGVAVYLLLYVIYPTEDTKSLFDAIFNL